MSLEKIQFELPSVTLPVTINAVTTTRLGGFSKGAHASFNLADHVGDDPQNVEMNRALLRQALALPSEPLWLQQVHSNRIANNGKADASYTRVAGDVLCVQSADCLPILIWDKNGGEIAAIHAGWRGLASSIIKKTIENFESRHLIAWVGPHIQLCHYEVDLTVYRKFSRYSGSLVQGRDAEHWQLSLAQVADQQLKEVGVQRIFRSESCTACDKERFFSYRRDGLCGRMATLIWMT